MKLLKKILLPVEPYAGAEEQLETLTAVAGNFGSEVILLSVLPEHAKIETLEGLVRKSAMDYLHGIKENLEAKGLHVSDMLLRYGSVGKWIIEEADEQAVNLILLGHGKSDTESAYKIGTTVEKIVRRSEKPVWVTQPGGNPVPANILCPVDFSPPSAKALQNAAKLARKLDAKITVLAVFEPISNASLRLNVDVDKENLALENEFKTRVETFLDPHNLDELKWELLTRRGKPADEILGALNSGEFDLLLMGSNGRSGINRFFMGSVTEKVIRESPVSFVTTKAEDMIYLQLGHEIKDIETHYNTGKKLIDNGYLTEAINQFEICLRINDMHIPSMYKLAELYKKTGQEKRAAHYEKMAQDLLRRLWDKQIELEIRKHFLR